MFSKALDKAWVDPSKRLRMQKSLQGDAQYGCTHSINPRPSHVLPPKGKGLLAESLPRVDSRLSSKFLIVL